MHNNKILASLLGGVLLLSSPANAEEIETIVVTGSTSHTAVSDPTIDVSILETLFPETTVAGRFGGFAGFTERGTQPTHTLVFRNGVPASDAGAGWYDFGHDLSTGNESATIVNGPNSVLYGSGSLGGTVFINDDIKPGSFFRVGEDHQFVSASFENMFNISYFDTTNDSVRTDNDEKDQYKNITARLNLELADWNAKINYTDYSYDFDQCWNNFNIFTNECKQEGKKGTFSLRNDSTTLGFTFNDADYLASDDKTWSSDAQRYYADHRQQFIIMNNDRYIAEALVGATVEREEYAGNTQNNVAIYGVAKRNGIEVGTRITQDTSVFRLGLKHKKFFANVGTSYLNPTLYQQHGDAWVLPNDDLDPEKAIGYEVGYNKMSFFYYKFSEGIDFNYDTSQYYNTGEYYTQGFRYVDTFFPTDNLWFRVDAGYTDSEQPRIGKYKFIATSNYRFEKFVAKLSYAGVFDRKPGPYDGDSLPDISSFDLSIQREFGRKYLISFTARDILDREFEVVPGYGAGGLQVFLSLQIKPE